MSIEASVVETIAEVEVDDDYQIALHVPRKRARLDWDQAEQLANELIEAVESAKVAMSEDFPRTHPAGIPHGFDVDAPYAPESVQVVEVAQSPAGGDFSRVRGAGDLPDLIPGPVVCRECKEGKCGACNGAALVEVATSPAGSAIVNVPCSCTHGQAAS